MNIKPDEQLHDFTGGTMDAGVQRDMGEMIRWTHVLAIFGFVFLALMVILGIGTGIAISHLSEYSTIGDNIPDGTGTVVAVLFTVLACILFYPNLNLYRYSVEMKRALQQKDTVLYATAIRHLKNMFKYAGITVIVITALLIIDIAISLMR